MSLSWALLTAILVTEVNWSPYGDEMLIGIDEKLL